MHKHLQSDRLVFEVKQAITEDIGAGDLTSNLIVNTNSLRTHIVAKESAILCGSPWVTEVYNQLDPNIHVKFCCNDGDSISANQVICVIEGAPHAILSGERVAINFLQTLSAVATKTNKFVSALKHTNTEILDTRKTIPGLRYSQKYAVKIGGGINHRLGLFDALLIKENHIAACGSISEVLKRAQNTYPNKPIQIEVENLEQLEEAIQAGAKFILLDNFSINGLKKCVESCRKRAVLEASGGITYKRIKRVAQTGVDRISVGTLTKDITAIDFSMRAEKTSYDV